LKRLPKVVESHMIGNMKRTLIFAATILAIVGPGFGQEASARWIMEQNYEQNRVEDTEAEFVMKLVHPKGHERTRQVVLYAKTDADGLDKSLIRFMSPADVRGVGLLSIDTEERENQWLYLPALQRVRRISSSQKSDSFMGSDFSYEDLESRELEGWPGVLCDPGLASRKSHADRDGLWSIGNVDRKGAFPGIEGEFLRSERRTAEDDEAA
jgi:hypothetical protein